MWELIYTAAIWFLWTLLGGVVISVTLAILLTRSTRKDRPFLLQKHDDGAWHTAGDPDATPAEAGAHIGLFFKWCLTRGLVNEHSLGANAVDPSQLEAVRSGDLSATEFLWENITCKFTEEELTDLGNAFARSYYDELYGDDLLSLVNKPAYSFTEADVDFELLMELLDQRFEEWRARERKEHDGDGPWF